MHTVHVCTRIPSTVHGASGCTVIRQHSAISLSQTILTNSTNQPIQDSMIESLFNSAHDLGIFHVPRRFIHHWDTSPRRASAETPILGGYLTITLLKPVVLRSLHKLADQSIVSNTLPRLTVITVIVPNTGTRDIRMLQPILKRYLLVAFPDLIPIFGKGTSDQSPSRHTLGNLRTSNGRR